MREIPYLGPTGVPFHKLNDAQRRGYTRGMSEEDAFALQQHCEMIGQRVTEHQAERQGLKKEVRELLTFPTNTPAEEREARAKKVGVAKRRYDKLEKDIIELKATVITYEPGTELALEPIE